MQDGGHTEKTQLEAGTVATPYVPYNSLEIKDVGENLFDCANSKIIYNNGNTSYERLDNGLKIISDGVSQYNMIYFLVDTVENLKGKTLTLSSDISFSKDNQLTSFGLYYTDTNGGNRKTIVDNTDITSEGKYQVTGQVEEGENRDYVCIGLRPNVDSNFAKGDYTIYDNLQVEIGETATNYEPYKSQVVTFPLGEEKLMEGSYLASDGIHHKRKQVVLDGSDDENWHKSQSYNGSYYAGQVLLKCVAFGECKCDFFKKADISNPSQIKTNYQLGTCFIENYSGTFNCWYDDGTASLENWKTWLSQNPITVEYELAEEEIVPYTTAQQEAWNNLQNIASFEGKNYIITDPYGIYIKIEYSFGVTKEKIYDIYSSTKFALQSEQESDVGYIWNDSSVWDNTKYWWFPKENLDSKQFKITILPTSSSILEVE